MAKQTDATWVTLDPATLAQEHQAAYAEYKEAYRAMKAARQGFEESLAQSAGLPEGKRMIYGYNFGKLSVAIVDDDRKPAKPKQASMSLADYLTTMQAAGRAS